jgi:hypothetical protein
VTIIYYFGTLIKFSWREVSTWCNNFIYYHKYLYMFRASICPSSVCVFYFTEYAICNVVYSLLDIHGISIVRSTLFFRRLCSHYTYNYSNHFYSESVTTMLYELWKADISIWMWNHVADKKRFPKIRAVKRRRNSSVSSLWEGGGATEELLFHSPQGSVFSSSSKRSE